jgi:hypothetical protein
MIDLRTPHPVRVPVSLADLDLGLFASEALAAASTDLSAERVVYHRAVGLPMVLPHGEVVRDQPSVVDVLDRLPESESWVMLAGLGTLERYRAAALRLAAPLVLAARSAGEQVESIDLIAFVAAPRTRVPFHCDRGHHLLVQVEGTKRLVVGWYDDPEVEARMAGATLGTQRRNPDRAPDRTEEIVLHPGDAVAMPAFLFHGVEESDTSSLALTAVVMTDATEAAGAALRAGRSG